MAKATPSAAPATTGVFWRSGDDGFRHAYTSRARGARALCGAKLQDERLDRPDAEQHMPCRAEALRLVGGPKVAASGRPKAARTVNRGRIYTINGQALWSVTTIIGNGLPKPAIAAWQARTIAEYAVANHRELSALVASVRLRDRGDGTYEIVADPDAVSGAVDWLKGAPWRESSRKMNIGSAVHAEAEAVQLGTPRPEPPGLIARYVESFRHFLDDFSPVIEMTEATVYSPRESYAGTLDNIMTVGGRRLLIDIKTGKDIYADVALQLAAYARAEFVLLDDGTSVPMLPVDGAAALHLREYDEGIPGDRGYSLIPVDIGEPVWNAFRYAREVMRWMEETSKGVLSQPLGTPDAVAFLIPERVAKGAA